MLGAYRSLLTYEKEMSSGLLAHNLSTFFSRQPGLMHQVWQQAAGGVHLHSYNTAFLQSIQESMACPYRFVKAIIDMRAPLSRYMARLK